MHKKEHGGGRITQTFHRLLLFSLRPPPRPSSRRPVGMFRSSSLLGAFALLTQQFFPASDRPELLADDGKR